MARNKKDDASEVPKPNKDDLIKTIAGILNDAASSKIAYIPGQDEDDPTTVTDWVSTGCDELDFAISNKPHGGLPGGKISEVTGWESSGKSLIVATAIAETQRRGGVGVLIDPEYATSFEFLEALGVNTKENFLYVTPDTVEEIFDSLEKIIGKIRTSQKDRLVTIAVDSMASATTKVEQASNYDKDGYATAKAIIISKAMRKITGLIARQRICLIFSNQLREKVGVIGFGDKSTTSGGKALGFHASVRIRLARLGNIKNTDKEDVGIKIKAKVYKNRLGPPFRVANFDMLFDRGIIRYENWFDMLKEKKIAGPAWSKDEKEKKFKKEPELKDKLVECEGKAAKLVFASADGKYYEFTRQNFIDMVVKNPVLKEEVYQKLCDVMVKKYHSNLEEMADTESLVFEEEGAEKEAAATEE